MKKADFVEIVKKEGGYTTKKDAEAAVDAFVAGVKKALSKKGDSVDLVGFGKFETALQKGKKGKTPGSGKPYKTEDKFVPKFRAGKALKDVAAKIKTKK